MTGAGGVTVGGVVSCTVTLKDADSPVVVLQTTVVSPSGKRTVGSIVPIPSEVEPSGFVQEIGKSVSVSLSFAEASYVTWAPLGPCASATMSLGTVTTASARATEAPARPASATATTSAAMRPARVIAASKTPHMRGAESSSTGLERGAVVN